MAFKMKNSSMAKIVKAAGDSREAMKAGDDGSKKKKSREATPDDIIRRSKSQRYYKDYYVDDGRGNKVSVKRDPDTGGYTYKGDYIDPKNVKEQAKTKPPRQLAAEAQARKEKESAKRESGEGAPLKNYKKGYYGVK